MLDTVIDEFLELLWPTNVPDAGLSICSAGLSRPPRQRFRFRRRVASDDREEFARECHGWAERGEDVYTGIGAVRLNAPSRGTAKDVIALPAFWAEIDINGPAHAEPTGVPSLQAAMNFMGGLGLDPSFHVESGHGLHLYWLLEEPWVLSQQPEWNRADSLHRRFGQTLQVKGGRQGYRLDPVYDLARVLRVPGTFNFKGGAPVPVVLHADPRPLVYAPDDFERWIAADTQKASVQVLYSPIEVVEEPEAEAALAVPPVGEAASAGIQWPVRFGPLIQKLKEIGAGAKGKPGSAILARKLLAREPLAEMGNRDNATNAAAGVLAYAAKYMPLSLDDLFAVLWGSVENMPGEMENPPPTKAEARAKLKGAMADAAAEVAKDRAEIDAFEESMVRAARADRKKEAAGITDLAEYRARQEAPETEDDTGYYTPEDIQRFADDNKCSVAEWKQRWIIYANKKYYLWTENRYVAWPAGHIGVAVAQQLAPARLDIYKRNKKGAITGIVSIDEIMRRYGTPCPTVEIDLAAPRTLYDSVRQVLVEAPCPVRTIAPVFHPRIDQWLRALGGAKQDKVLDWVATVTELRSPTSAIYLEGTASAGKSLFALGMARLWGTSPSSFTQVFGSNFNGDLARCPMVFADEALPDSREKDITAVLRDAVSQEERTINRKHQDEMTMHGAVRIVIAGNNPDLILKSAKGLSGTDLDAYVKRFLHIKVPAAAAELLESWGGRATTNDWVTGNKIAEHAMWLAKNRVVPMGKRFRVDGEETSMHRAIVAKGASKVLEWQVQYLGLPLPPKEQVAIVGEGVVLVSTSGIFGNWREMEATSHEASPGLKAIGSAIKSISYEEPLVVKKDGREVRYRVVDPDHLTDLIRDTDGNIETFNQRLQGPLPAWLRDDLLARTKVEKHPWLQAWRKRQEVGQ